MNCPECGSAYLRLNAMFDMKNYLMYTCGDCNNQFNPVPEEIITISKSEYDQLLRDQEWL